MRAYEDVIRETTRRELATWPLGVAAPTLPRMQAITFRVVLRAVFGVREGPDLERLAARLQRFVAWAVDPRRGLIFTALGPERLMNLKAYRRQHEGLDRELLAEIARRRTAPDLAEREDILSLLLQARDDQGAPLTDRELRDELVTLLVAGHETTAAALSWALVELARDPVAQARLAAGEEGLAEAAVAETLRLHPPLPVGAVRRLRRPLTIAGWDCPPGRRSRSPPCSPTAGPTSTTSPASGASTASSTTGRRRAPGCPSAAACAAAWAPLSRSSRRGRCSRRSPARWSCAAPGRGAVGSRAAGSSSCRRVAGGWSRCDGPCDGRHRPSPAWAALLRSGAGVCARGSCHQTCHPPPASGGGRHVRCHPLDRRPGRVARRPVGSLLSGWLRG
jgi:hypothetical protein